MYGTKGIASPDNVPGARDAAISWIDSYDNLWLFGGEGSGDFNDLWKFTNESYVGTTGTIGTTGTVSAAIWNVPSFILVTIGFISLGIRTLI
jgi:hypothetical protein